MHYLNLPLLKIVKEYLSTKTRLHKKTINNIFTFTDNLIKYSESNELNIPKNYTIKQFSDYKSFRSLLQKNNYLTKISNKGYNKAEGFSFTDEFNKYKLYQYSIDELYEYFTNDKNDEVFDILSSEFSFLTNITKSKLNKKPKLTYNERKSTTIALTTRESRKNIEVNGEKLAEIDICTSCFSLSSSLSFDSISEEEQQVITNYLSGDIYKIISETSANKLTRDDVKDNFMSFLFSSNQGQKSKEYKFIDGFFKQNLPEYHSWLYDIRKWKNTEKRLASKYYRLERNMINSISKELSNNSIENVSIYDAVLVPVSSLKEATTIFNKKLKVINESLHSKTEIINSEEPIVSIENEEKIETEVYANNLKEEIEMKEEKIETKVNKLMKPDITTANIPKTVRKRKRSYKMVFKEPEVIKVVKELSNKEIFDSIK